MSLPTLSPLLLLFPLIILPLLYFKFLSPSPSHPDAPLPTSDTLPLIGSVGFYTRRWDFFRDSIARSKTGNFSFTVAGVRCVGLSGEGGRETFFGSPRLDFTEGYKVMFGASPDIESAKLGLDNLETSGAWFNKRLIGFVKKERLENSLERLIADVREEMDALGDEGIMDPFKVIWELVFKLTLRTVGCKEIAEDPVLRARTLALFEEIAASGTGVETLIPYVPAWSKIRKTVAGTKLYLIFKNIIDERKRTGKSEDDPLQVMIDEGDSTVDILVFIVGALFAGLINSGITASYLICYLALSPHYLSRALNEITTAASLHAPPSSSSSSSSLSSQLSLLPLDAWETSFPVLSVCLKETIRLHTQGTGFRKNMHREETVIGPEKETIAVGEVVIYHFADVHMDEEIYSDPGKWDPARWREAGEGREEGEREMDYIGWGKGRHPCLGMKFAKLKSNLVVAFFLANFQFRLVNEQGEPETRLPDINPNAHAASKPTRKVWLAYERKWKGRGASRVRGRGRTEDGAAWVRSGDS